ncbi:MAG: hypothetical protein E7327_12555 [Clostridiales bacterium]|nr:hypothetical protein [Clostridiales bacterium]
MPDLYWHEIPCPDDRAIRKFLWYSAFHDGELLSVCREDARSGNDVVVRISHSVLHSLARCGTYRLRFSGVKDVRFAGIPLGWSDRIYDMHFLDSAALHQEQAETPALLYHLRIVTWCGYVDLIFEHFSIRLENGRVSYRMPAGLDDALITANRERRIRLTHAEYAAQLRRSPDALDDAELDEYHACALYLTAAGQDAARTAALARETLSLPPCCREARTYAAFLLGRCGTADDLPSLMQLFLSLPSWHCLQRRRVLDAMERLNERSR